MSCYDIKVKKKKKYKYGSGYNLNPSTMSWNGKVAHQDILLPRCDL